MNFRMLPLFVALLATSMTAEVQAAAKQFLWVTNAYGNDVHVVDVSTHRVIKRVEVGPNPHGIAAPDAAHVLYEADRKTYGGVWEFDAGVDHSGHSCRVRIDNREYQRGLLRLTDLLNSASRVGYAAWIRI